MSLHHKKSLTFSALPYHQRILCPVIEELQKRGGQNTWFTVAAEACFEATMREAQLPYVHALEMLTPAITDHIEHAWQDVRQEWQRRFLKSRWTLQVVPLVIQDKIIRSMIENYYCFEELVRRIQPDVIFSLHEINSWGKMLGHIAHKNGIPFITFQEGLCYAHSWCYQCYTDYSTACIVWGDDDEEVLVKAGSDPRKIHKFGSIDLWPAIARVTTPEAIAAERSKLAIPEGMQVVLFFMAYHNYGAFEIPGVWQWMVQRGNVCCIFKWHPAMGGDVLERATTHLKGKPFVASFQEYDTAALLGVADVCVLVGNSTTGVEALAYGKPLIEVPLPMNPYSFARYGVCEQWEDLNTIGMAITPLLDHGIPYERAQQIEAYLQHHFAYRDERAAERTINLVEEILYEKDAQRSNGDARGRGSRVSRYGETGSQSRHGANGPQTERSLGDDRAARSET